MTLELLTNLKFVHRTNIARYKKILATYLTDGERHFVERRLAEEQASLEQPDSGQELREVLSCPRVDEMPTPATRSFICQCVQSNDVYGSHIAAQSSLSVYVGLAPKQRIRRRGA